jgi:hypothetical protein
MPMVHPTTGETISSYKKLMNNPATMEIWQTAFGKDFGGMAQRDNKTGQKGTNAIFVMKHAEVLLIPADRTITYVRVVVDFCPQKADPHCIRITAGGNLISYPGELTTQTADLTTSKLMRNSVLSTKGTKYMCLDIKKFYLTAGQCGAFPRQASWQTSCSKNVSSPMVITNVNIPGPMATSYPPYPLHIGSR